MESKIILCEIKGKMAYKKGEDGYCYTFNKNEKSRRHAFNLAKKAIVYSTTTA